MTSEGPEVLPEVGLLIYGTGTQANAAMPSTTATLLLSLLLLATPTERSLFEEVMKVR